MGAVHVTYYTDPACPWSWATEPTLARLRTEFGGQVAITYVMGGLAREFQDPVKSMRELLEAAAASAMPTDPRLWLDAPPRSSYPACQAVKAAAEQQLDGPYLRVLREGFMVDARRLDAADALADAARIVPGMDVARFMIDLRSNASVEAFGIDLERTRAAGIGALPAFDVEGARTEAARLRDAVLAAGARPGPLPSVEEAVRARGRVATPEVAAACDRPGPLAAAELWRLAAEWRVRPERVLTGELWHVA